MSKENDPEQQPRPGRFAKGTSGNPKGRPKARPTGPASAFDIVIDRTLSVTRGGVEREVTLEEALQHKTYQNAISGNRAARREILKMIAKREKAIAAKAPKPAYRIEMRMEPKDPDNADAALLLLGIACHDIENQHSEHERKHLKLEPWAVQMALSRRRGGQALTEKDIAEIRRCTRSPETLRWPRGSGQ